MQRLGDVDGAIQDYDKCIAIAHSVSESSGPTKVTLAAVYANRAGLLKVKGETAAAMEDIRTAIELDASNLKYRETLCLLHRVISLFQQEILFFLIKLVWLVRLLRRSASTRMPQRS